MTTFCTSRVNYTGLDGVDTTVKNNPNHVLSPTWNMVSAHKAGRISDEEYTQRYVELLRKRYASRSKEFLALFDRKVVTLKCFCKHDEFCHRRLAIEVLKQIAKSKGLDFSFGGERYGISGEYIYTGSGNIQYQYGQLARKFIHK